MTSRKIFYLVKEHNMKRHFFAISVISLACISSAFAATPIDLKNQPASILQSSLANNNLSFKQISSDVDFNHTTHKRIQQYFSGYPVWGADAVVHEKPGLLAAQTTMNGTAYQGLQADLAGTPAYIFNAAQADKALQAGTELYQKKTGVKQFDLTNAKKKLMVYVDKNNKAHWAFFVSFLAESERNELAVPTYILDAASMNIYEEWNDAQTLDNTQAGGFGGNQKMGKLTYDGSTGDYPVLAIQRDAAQQLCYLKNDFVTVFDDNHKPLGPFGDAAVAQFKCNKQDDQHNKLYWDADQDSVDGGYSPANDALYIGKVIHEMYQNWYGIPVLSQAGKAMMLKMNVHAKDIFGNPMDNAEFLNLNSEMYFGDGKDMFYPLTSLGVGAHEISHGFTAQHSNLTYEKQSGGLNEAFSDMAAQAAEFYSVGKNSWQIGPEILKGSGALRYMDDPTKDGKSIGNAKDYNDSLNVHYTSGVFNKAFYLLGTAPGWDTKKAFDVMVKANMHYWTSNSTFADAACGVMSATKDYNYDTKAVADAMNGVGIDVSHC